MKNNFWMLVAVAMTSALSGACTSEVADSGEEIAESEGEVRIMNGDRLSGVALSGASVNGASLSGVNFTGMNIGGLTISNVTLNGTTLSGQLPSGQTITGADFISATMTGSMSDGSQISLRIDDVQPSADAEILTYKISYRQVGGTYAPICGYQNDGSPALSFPLAGRWDHTVGTATGGSHINDAGRFSIACRGAALAKCVENAGFKPWRTTQECNSSGSCHDVSLADLHQACVRMIRADYCGDGASHTVIGTEIDMFDAFGMKTEDTTAQWSLEAEWKAGGAQCVVHPRWVSAEYGDVVAYMQAHCPSRYTPPESGIECGRESSTFNTDVGYGVSLDQRVLVRNKSEVHQ